jgi:hypothetical protein
MDLLVKLHDDKEAALRSKALAQGISAEEFAALVLNRELESPPKDSGAIWTTTGLSLKPLPKSWPMSLPTCWPGCRRMAQASITTTFTAGPRETFELGFCRHVLLDRTDPFG